MRWWGWGEDEGAITLPEPALALLHDELGMEGSEQGMRVELGEVELPAPALAEAARRELDPAGLSEEHGDRVSHAVGRSYPDLVRIRAGDGSGAPDAVVRPKSADQLRAALAACARAAWR